MKPAQGLKMKLCSFIIFFLGISFKKKAFGVSGQLGTSSFSIYLFSWCRHCMLWWFYLRSLTFYTVFTHKVCFTQGLAASYHLLINPLSKFKLVCKSLHAWMLMKVVGHQWICNPSSHWSRSHCTIFIHLQQASFSWSKIFMDDGTYIRWHIQQGVCHFAYPQYWESPQKWQIMANWSENQLWSEEGEGWLDEGHIVRSL